MFTRDMWQLTGDMWHVTPDTWHVTPDMWQVGAVNLLSKCQLPSSYGLQSIAICCDPLQFIRIQCDQLRSIWIHRDPLKSIEIHWDSLGCIDHVDHLGHLDHLDHLESFDIFDHLICLDYVDHLYCLDHLDNRYHPDHLYDFEELEVLEELKQLMVYGIMGWQTRHTHKQWICQECIEILQISWTPPPRHCETTRHSSQDVEQEILNTTPWIHWNCSPNSGESPLTKQTQSHKASNYWDPIWTLTNRGLGRGHFCTATRRGSPH